MSRILAWLYNIYVIAVAELMDMEKRIGESNAETMHIYKRKTREHLCDSNPATYFFPKNSWMVANLDEGR